MLACLNACVVGLAPGYLDGAVTHGACILNGLLQGGPGSDKFLGLAGFWVWQGSLVSCVL